MLRIRTPTVLTTEEARCVKQNNLLCPKYVGTEKADNPVRLARSQSCNLALFSLDRAHLRSLSTSLKRPMSAPSLPKDSSSTNAKVQKVKTDWPICLPRTASCWFSPWFNVIYLPGPPHFKGLNRYFWLSQCLFLCTQTIYSMNKSWRTQILVYYESTDCCHN